MSSFYRSEHQKFARLKRFNQDHATSKLQLSYDFMFVYFEKNPINHHYPLYSYLFHGKRVSLYFKVI